MMNIMNRNIARSVGLMVLTTVFSLSAQATVINNTPPDFDLAYFDFTGPDVAGGTFIADDTQLDSFTLTVAENNSGGTFSAVIMSMNGGLPDTLLWASSVTAIPVIATELMFDPDFALTVGTEYFIGIDTGQLTLASGSLNLGYTFDNIAGQHYESLNGGGFSGNSDYDIASRIVMNSASVPAPSILALMGIGLAGIGLARRKIAA